MNRQKYWWEKSYLQCVYYLECDECHRHSPHEDYPSDAKARAREKGWVVIEWWNGFSHVHRCYCPNCWEAKRAEIEAEIPNFVII